MLKFLQILIGYLGLTVFAHAQENSTQPVSQFIYVKIPEQIEPIARGEKYEDPLDAFLKTKKIGDVSGGGTMMSKPDKDGHKEIVYVGLDVDLSDFTNGLPLLKDELIRLGVPKGTVLEYARNGTQHSDPVK